MLQGIITVTVRVDGDLLKADLDKFLQNLLWEKSIKNSDGKTIQVLRLKVMSELVYQVALCFALFFKNIFIWGYGVIAMCGLSAGCGVTAAELKHMFS